MDCLGSDGNSVKRVSESSGKLRKSENSKKKKFDREKFIKRLEERDTIVDSLLVLGPDEQQIVELS